MAKPTPLDVPSLPRDIYIDEHQLDGHVVLTVVTSCGHPVEVATVNKAWYDLDPGEDGSIERELRQSLDRRCNPWHAESRCARCPFAPLGLRVMP